ncbi:hypothetical protein NDU88_000019 [Pleurodeles waltl]|uniref:Uncharacterized protein n=1 Tax=Pleurodeles waltl TaxID=8319 RepID=A0AAV7SVD9_PLEWA|nr:hypothetical protein NDU88_000019 [Pleurodeles waltl]
MQRSHQSKRQGSQRASAHSNAGLPPEQTTRLPKGQSPQQCSAPVRANNKDPKGSVPTAMQRSRQSKQQGSQRVSAHSNAGLPSEQTTRLPKDQCPQQRSAPIRANNKDPKGPVPTATLGSRQSEQQGFQRVSPHSNAALPSEQTTRLPKGQCTQQCSSPVRGNNKAPKGPVPIATQGSHQSKRQGSQRASAHSNAALPSEGTTRLPKGQCPQQRSAPIRANNKDPKGSVTTAPQQRSSQREQQGSQRVSAHSNAVLPSEQTTRLPKDQCPQQRSAPVRVNNKAPKGSVPTAMQRSHQSEQQGSQRVSAHSTAAVFPSAGTTRLPKDQCPQQCSAPIRANNKDPKGPVPTATQRSRQSKQQGSQRASAHSNAGLPSERTTRLPKGQCPQQRSAPVRANNKAPKGPVPTATQRSHQSEQQGSQRASAHSNAAALSNAALPSEGTTRLPKDQCPQQCSAPVRANNKAP